jgi:diguanylate cyclase (GGDEF)-like protein/putative nucleotidyltransferase with HDIG domain
MKSYPLPARVFIYLCTSAGVAVLTESLFRWRVDSMEVFWGFLLASVFSSFLKVTLPGIAGTMSLNYICMLMGVLRLNLGETVVVSIAATLAQSLWKAKTRPKPVQLIFNVCSVSIAIRAAYYLFHAPLTSAISSLFVRLALASAAYFLVNTLSIAVVIALTEGKGLRNTWEAFYFWSFPYYLAGSSIAVLFDQTQARYGWGVILVAFPILFILYRSYRLYLKQLEIEKSHAEHMAALHLRTIEALALAIDAKDEGTHEHLRRVQVYAKAIGSEMGMTGLELQALEAASILHDVGKLAVPDYIISKPGKLTPEEFEKMKIHPVVGAEILERVEFPYPVVPIVRSHHERWDGTGYPDGLKGEEIPLGARILAAVDCLDALASDRQYRRALPLEQAMQEVQRLAGKNFDPQVVTLLASRYLALEGTAHSTPVHQPRLASRDLPTPRGESPGAGFEGEAERPAGVDTARTFLTSIAAARQEVQSLFELTQDLGSSLSLRETLSVVAARLTSLVPYDCIAIYSLTGDNLVPKFVNGENARLFASLEIPMGQGLSGWVAENQKPILNGNPSVEPGYLNDPARFSTLRSSLAVPLKGAHGFRGVLTLHHSNKNAFTRDHLRVLLAIGSKVALAIENALSFQHAQEQASTDALTGLPNAGSLFLHLAAELERASRGDTTLSVLVCDLDGFKALNDRFGHLHGNEALRSVAEIFRSECRKYDYVARMGGDEFVLVFSGIEPGELAIRVDKLRSAVKAAGQMLCGSEILDISIGAAHYPKDGNEAELLLAEADRDMYRVKQHHKSGGLASLADTLFAENEPLIRGTGIQPVSLATD